MVRHSLPLPETIVKSAEEGIDGSCAPWLLGRPNKKTNSLLFIFMSFKFVKLFKGMHRKSLEAAEHIRKQDEKDLINGERSLSPIESLMADSSDDSNSERSSPPPPSVTSSTQKTTTQTAYPHSIEENCESYNRKELIEQDKSKKRDELKSESVANLRAKAKEHSAKIMGNITANESSKSYSDNKSIESDGIQCAAGCSDSSNSSTMA